jgi:ATP-binding cassette subfamily A (ABC1) protein 3
VANHLKALLTKNYILWRRNLLCSCCEILLPTILIFALIGIRSSIEKTDVPEISYVNFPLLPVKTLYPDAYNTPKNTYFNPTNDASRIKNCKNHRVSDKEARNGPIALIPPTSSIM